MDRARFRGAVVLAGLVLLAASWLAPQVSPSAIRFLSVAWLLAGGYLLFATFLILGTWVGRGSALVVVALAGLAPIALTAIPFPPALAVRAPCPRNWGWLPAWMLRSSPIASVLLPVDGTTVKVCYGRPAARGRRMLGGKYVPFGRLWRTGANEPTTIITPVALDVAGVIVPPGRASLYTVPGPETWEIILNRSTSQWGIESEYTEAVRAQELGRAIVPSEKVAEPAERLTFTVEPEAGGNSRRADLVLQWEGTRVRIPVQPGPR